MSGVLKKVIKEAQGSKEKLVCVFDIDSTLFSVSKRTQKILRELPSHSQTKQICDDQAELFKSIQVSDTDFGLFDILKKANIRLTFDCYKEVFDYWSTHFFSNEFLKYDTLYKGADIYLNKLKDLNVEIIYLTGRSQSFMGEGTYLQLDRWNLPLKTKKHLIMKPNNYTEDAHYKKEHLSLLSNTRSNIWFFENEPAVINFVHSFLPQIQIVFMDSAHSGRQGLTKDFHKISMDYRI